MRKTHTLALAMPLLLGASFAPDSVDDFAETDDRFGQAVAAGDFNGDGEEDLAIGAYLEDIGRITDAGAVHVLYGTTTKGLSSTEGLDDQFWHQDSPGVADLAEAGDQFGAGMAAGNFNGDRYDDLAIRASNEDVNGVADAGAVTVLYGSKRGLRTSGAVKDQFWHQDVKGVADAPETGDGFGAYVTAGDYNGDRIDDLAIAALYEDIGAFPDAGAVHVIYGSEKEGLHVSATRADQFWHQDSPEIEDDAEADDQFGWSLRAGDYNGDGRDDLAAGVRYEDVGAIVNAGAVNVIYGSGRGLHVSAVVEDQIWHQDVPEVEDPAESSDEFGARLAAGDFDGNGTDDLAIGVRYEDVGAVANAGAVNVLYGSGAVGLSASETRADQFWHQDVEDIQDVAEASDYFGFGLAAGDFDGDRTVDLAIGAYGENLDAITDAGAVHVIHGSYQGLSALFDVDNQFWHQDVTNVEDDAEGGDIFGVSLIAGNFDGSNGDDLAIGAYSEDVGSVVNAGSVNVIYGHGDTGLNQELLPYDQFWSQDSN